MWNKASSELHHMPWPSKIYNVNKQTSLQGFGSQKVSLYFVIAEPGECKKSGQGRGKTLISPDKISLQSSPFFKIHHNPIRNDFP